MIGANDLANRFTYHSPDEERAKKHAHIREQCFSLSNLLDSYLPDGREKSLAITKLEEVMFWANASIARNN